MMVRIIDDIFLIVFKRLRSLDACGRTTSVLVAIGSSLLVVPAQQSHLRNADEEQNTQQGDR